MTANAPAASSPDPSRRHLIKAAAWSIPVVTLATAAPAAASSVPPTGTLTVYYQDWFMRDHYGEVQVALDPAPGPAVSAENVTFDSPAFEITLASYTDGTDSMFIFTFEDISTPPDQFTATVTIPGYTPVVVQFPAG
jgi:hypothetical protein